MAAMPIEKPTIVNSVRVRWIHRARKIQLLLSRKFIFATRAEPALGPVPQRAWPV